MMEALTVGQLKEHLQEVPDNYLVFFVTEADNVDRVARGFSVDTEYEHFDLLDW